jgi:hypothetical protein
MGAALGPGPTPLMTSLELLGLITAAMLLQLALGIGVVVRRRLAGSTTSRTTSRSDHGYQRHRRAGVSEAVRQQP